MAIVAETSDDRRMRLARLVTERRKALGISVSAASRQAKIDRGTWTGVEKGTRETEEYLYARFEEVLGWATGSIDDILAGGEPTLRQPVQSPERARRVDLPHPLPSDEAIARVMNDPRVPEDEKPRIVQILIEDRERELQRRLALAESLIRDHEETA